VKNDQAYNTEFVVVANVTVTAYAAALYGACDQNMTSV
jgi:hypothetical protein